MKIVFVILQYMAAMDTIDCIESIRHHIDIKDYAIIVVDNCSPDDAYSLIKNKYKDTTDIIVIRNDNNLGFARGNNIGYVYAITNFSPEFIVLLNSDILLIQNHFYSMLKMKYNQYGFSVLGPMILTRDGKYLSNPASFSTKPLTRKDALKSIIKFNIKMFLSKLHLLRFLDFCIKIIRSKATFITMEKYTKDYCDVRLHGSFMVFSKDYQIKFPLGLDNRTFMYGEEIFLQYHLVKNNLKSLYTPAYVVYHKEDSSTDCAYKQSMKKEKFVILNNIRSKKRYIELLNENSK